MKSIREIIVTAFYFFMTFSMDAQSPVFIWAKQVGGPQSDIGHSIVTDISGDVFIAGRFRGTVDFDPGPGVFNLYANTYYFDIFILKLDSNGNFLWAKQLGGPGTNDEGISAIVLDNIGNIYMTGNYRSTADFDPGSDINSISTAGQNDVFVVKLDNNGNFIWARGMGGSLHESGVSLAVNSVGEVYTVGIYDGTADFDPGTGIFNMTAVSLYDTFISKLDSNGNFVWAKSIGGPSNDMGQDIALNNLGDIIVTGGFAETVDFDPSMGVYYITDTVGNSASFFLKLDSSGNFIWAKSIGGVVGSSCSSSALALDSAENIYSTGSFEGIIDFDPTPGVFYMNSLDDIRETYISKLDSAGGFIWATKTGGTGNGHSSDIALDKMNNVYVVSSFEDTIDFDPDTAVVSLSSFGGYDIFISKFDSLGNFHWVKRSGGGSRDEGNSVAVDRWGDVYTTGDFQNTVDFDPDGSGFGFTSFGGSFDAYVNKIHQSTVGVFEHENSSSINTYPNPTHGPFNLSIPLTTKNTLIEIYNNIGALVLKQVSTNHQITIDLTPQSNGIYFVKIINDNTEVTTQKIIKQ